MKKIVCFGNSNTYGYVPSLGGRFDISERWSDILKTELADKNIDVAEEGVNGRTTVFDDPVSDDKNGRKFMPSVLRRNVPVDLLIIMLGTNDCKIKFGADARTITNGLDTLVTDARKLCPGISILLIAPPVINSGVMSGRFAENFDRSSIKKSELLASEYRGLSEKRFCSFIDASLYARTDLSDGIHLAAEEHRNLASAVKAFIEKEYPWLYGK